VPDIMYPIIYKEEFSLDSILF